MTARYIRFAPQSGYGVKVLRECKFLMIFCNAAEKFPKEWERTTSMHPFNPRKTLLTVCAIAAAIASASATTITSTVFLNQ